MKSERRESSLNDAVSDMERSFCGSKKCTLYRFVINKIERILIEHTLSHTGGNQIEASRVLGINRNTLRSKIRNLGIKIQ